MISNLGKRLIIASIGIPVILFVSYLGGWWLYALCLSISILGSWELAAMLMSKNVEIGKRLATLLAIAIVSAFQFSAFLHFGLLIAAVLFMTAAVWRMLETGIVDYVSRLALVLLSTIYPGMFISFAILIHRDFAPVGWVLLTFTFVNTWIADTFAFSFGRKFGIRQLAPAVSPKKTWVGFLASFPGGLVAALPAHLILPTWSLSHLLVLSLIATSFGQIGDLIESAMKRDCGVKDSSNLIPGHGGVLDRFDSLIAALPAVYFAAKLLGP
jgi:phosphatidate cytidylyltransferase